MADEVATPDHYSVSDAVALLKKGLESINIRIIGEVTNLQSTAG